MPLLSAFFQSEGTKDFTGTGTSPDCLCRDSPMVDKFLADSIAAVVFVVTSASGLIIEQQ
jgi:hypothetical protein